MIQIQCLTEYEQLQKVVLCQPTYMSIEEAIERMLPITRIPNADSFMKGVMNLRGVIIPVSGL